jgi:hypothetical protein
MKRRFLLLSLSMLLLTGCGGSPQTRAVELDQEAVVSVRERVLLSDARATVMASTILEDSRCPPFADCIREGQILVAFQIQTVGGMFTQVASLPPLGASRTPPPYSGYDVALVQVTPENGAGKIPDQNYRLTIRVTKAP